MNEYFNEKNYITNNFSSSENIEKIVAKKLTGSILWMIIGLIISGITGYAIYKGIETQNPYALIIASNFYIPIFLEIILVIIFASISRSANSGILKVVFVLYSASAGFTFTVAGLQYAPESILTTFGIAVSVFVVMAIFGLTTKNDLTKLGSILGTALLLMIIVSIVNIFIKSSSVYMTLSLIGTVVFTLFIGYDLNKIKKEIISAIKQGDDKIADKIAIFGALTLYLDFINLFLDLLGIAGKKK